jgi:hypothetical protein
MSAVTKEKSEEIINHISGNLDKISIRTHDEAAKSGFVFSFGLKTFSLSKRGFGPLLSSLGNRFYLDLISGSSTYTIYPYRGLSADAFVAPDRNLDAKLEIIYNQLVNLYNQEVDDVLGEDFFKS